MNIFSHLLICCLIFLSNASPPCDYHHGHGPPCSLVPAKAGHTPACADGSTFCENVKDYPMDVIKKLLKNYPSSKDLFTDEVRSEFKKPKEVVDDDHSSHDHPFKNYFGHGRHSENSDDSSSYEWNGNVHNSNRKRGHHQYPGSFNFFEPKSPSYRNYYRRSRRESLKSDKRVQEEFLSSISPARSKRQISENREQLCEIRTNYINPQAALNSRGNWMYVVNGVDTATQLVRTETCASRTQQCSSLCQLPNGYTSLCEQKYVQKRLIALDSGGERFYSDTFWFPSCCVCTLSNL